MLAADAASTCRLRAGERVLKAARAARTLCGLDAPPSPVSSAAACTPHRLRRRVAQEATPCTGQRSSCRCSLRAGRSPSHRVASCASLRQRRTSRLAAAVPSSSCAWARTSPLARASRMPAPPALRRPAGAGAPSRQHWRRPVLPAVLTAAAPLPSLRPSRGKGTSRPLPSAVPGHQRPGTAHGERRSA